LEANESYGEMSDFFESLQPAAVLKHGLLGRYAHYFAGPAATLTNGKVAYIDGYAGAGRYEDGTEGSPLLLLSQAERVKLFDRKVRLEFVEKHPERAAQLRDSLTAANLNEARVHEATFEEAIADINESLDGWAKLFFLDPFSLGLPFADLTSLLLGSGPTDVIYHFSTASVARMAAAVTSDNSPEGTMPKRLDECLGPDVDWRAAFDDYQSNDQTAYSIASSLAREFAVSVSERSGVKATVVDVRKRPGTAPIYAMALFSSNAKAHWSYCDMAGKAYVDWLLRCDKDEFDANKQALESIGVQTLFEEVSPTEGDIDEKLRDAAVHYLKHHLREILDATNPTVLVDDITTAYGDYLGRARATHLRAAIKELYAAGEIDDDGVKDFFMRPIRLTR